MTQRSHLRGRVLLSLLLAPLLAAPASAGTLSTLDSFTNGADGGSPIGGVARDAAGTLYGDTRVGGAVACTFKAGHPNGGRGTVDSSNPKDKETG